MSDAASRAALARELGDRVGGDRRANTVLLQHVFGGAGAAAPGALLFRAFADHALFFDPRDDKIGSTLLTGREWQRPMVQRALALLREAGRAPEGKGLIDAGANIGATLTYLMRDGGFAHAHAFEPDPWNRNILTRNLDLNTLAASVTVCAEALGEAEGEVL
ncbi:MAG: FkbM family methyltransferase, partial [Pseudomonadota bacterium]